MNTLELRKILAFHFLKEEELQTLAGYLEEYQLKNGETLLGEHEVSPYVYFILDGALNVLVENNDHSQAYISMLGQGETFGESGIFPQLERNATITGAMDTQLVRLHRKKLLEFISKSPHGGIKFLMMVIYGLIKKLRILNKELAYERLGNSGQVDIDSLVSDFMKDLN